ncbi:MAG: hypothetical protein ACR2OJ_11285 [Hyphomicrobiales bacterium]
MKKSLKNIALSGSLLIFGLSATAALAQDMEIEWRSADGRKLSITAPGGNFSYGVKGGDFSGYNSDGSAYRVGNLAISYNANGKPYRIGGVDIAYNANGSVQRVGGL